MNGRNAPGIPRALVFLALGLALLLAGLPAAVQADGPSSSSRPSTSSSTPEDPDYGAAVQAIKAERFHEAIRLLDQVVAREGRNADAYNWLGYATRRSGNPSAAIPLYEKALSLDPKHRGAHEYLGEAYLQLDNLPKAKELLARLDSLCFFSCEEYRDLKKAVQAYEQSGGKVKPTATR